MSTYVCIEGVDGSGKTTLVKYLARRFDQANTPAVDFHFPSTNPVGAMIRQSLRGELQIEKRAYLYLFCADAMQADREIRMHLKEGKHVICDRHPTVSGRVFQVDYHQPDQVNAVYDSASSDGIRFPDYLFVLYVPPRVSLDRMRNREKYKDMVFETEDYDRMVELQHRYIVLAEQYDAHILDGTLPTHELADAICDVADL